MDLSIYNSISQYNQIVHPIYSKILRGELYATTAPGF